MSKRVRQLSEVPRPVIQRWMRLRLFRKAQSLGRAIARWRLPRAERANRKATEETFETIKYYAIRNENGQFPALSTLMNIGLYLMLAQRDIQAAKIDALTHPVEWNRKLYARIILLTIYEWDADSVSGRALRDALEIVDAPDDLKKEAFKALRALRSIQDKAKKQFGFVRNAAIAHRDPDALVQYRAIRDLKIEDVMRLGGEFYSAIEQFIAVLTKLTAVAGTPRTLLRQWIAKEGLGKTSKMESQASIPSEATFTTSDG